MALVINVKKVKAGCVFQIRGTVGLRAERSEIIGLLRPKLTQGVRNFVVEVESLLTMGFEFAEDLGWASNFIAQRGGKMILLDPKGSIKSILDNWGVGDRYVYAQDQAGAETLFIR